MHPERGERVILAMIGPESNMKYSRDDVRRSIKCFRLEYYGQITDNNHQLCHYSISDLVAAYVTQYSTPEYSAA
jgi:hypothetical protein